ncbi:hypothetical protein C2I27_04165 [Priestia megaterium]|uniref:hypothetical protein n=1 Tax=Priestia megaterium TaxID=1404 RepID=UPI000D5137B7|nr:hypothetical protein [Priestia megaterium]PVC75088.1 hypothetical protein C2I27_04165 [Priestia megaterium]
MGKPISSIPIGSWVKDPSTVINGSVVKWKVLDNNHKNYPSNTTTLIGITTNPQVSPRTVYKDSTKFGFRDLDIMWDGQAKTIGYLLDLIYSQFSRPLQKLVVPTPLQIRGGSNNSGGTMRTEAHNVFLWGAYEMNAGSSTFLSGTPDQSYFPSLSAYSNSGLQNYLGIDSTRKILSRDVYVRSDPYFTYDPGYIYGQKGQDTNSAFPMDVLPMINITSDVLVSDQPDTDRAYVLDLVSRSNLVQDGTEIKKWDLSSTPPSWSAIGQAPATKEMFTLHGIKDTSSIPAESWKVLGKGFKILCFSDQNIKMNANMNVPKSIYDSTQKSYKGKGAIETLPEVLPQGRKSLIVDAEHTGCTFEYSLNNGKTWYNVILKGITDISNVDGSSLIIRASLPTTAATLTSLSYAWA